MSYFVVFQNKTYQEEKEGGYLWAPQKTNQGRRLFHWDNMMKIRKGDIIFSMYRQHLVSVNIATFGAIEDSNPFGADEANPWERTGWMVKAEYNELLNPVSIREHTEDILRHSPPKYSPFTRTGGGTQGYLFEIDETFGEYFLDLVRQNNPVVNESREREIAEIMEIEELVDRAIATTEKERIIKSRIGQGLFKKKLLSRSSECEICGLDVPSLLIASHCKPWSESDNFERLDANNGLLLCANHDGVFDKGLISFDSNGQIIISPKVEPKNYELLNLNQQITISIKSVQQPYLDWHRTNKLQ